MPSSVKNIDFARSSGPHLRIFLFILLLGTTSSCGDPARAQGFFVEAVTAGAGPLHLNEPIVLRMSDALRPGVQPQRSVAVTDATGTRQPVEVRADGRHLIVKPWRDPQGLKGGMTALWPISSHLNLKVSPAVAGRELRSRSGEILQNGFHAKIPLVSTLRQPSGSLALTNCVPDLRNPDHMETLEVGPKFEISLRFNAALRASSLTAGIQIMDQSRGRGLESADIYLDQDDHRLVHIRPFPSGFLHFNADTPYRILLTRSLRTVDGRSLPQNQTLNFRTADTGQRLLQMTFAEKQDFDQGSRKSWNPIWRLLRPYQEETYSWTVVSGESTSLAQSFRGDGSADVSTLPSVFSGIPSRSQILIPGDRFLSDQPCMITGVAFIGSSIAPTTRCELSLGLGFLHPDRRMEGLSAQFQANVVADSLWQVRLPVDRDGYYHFPSSSQADVQPWEQFELEFLEPYLHPGQNQDLVLEIHNQSGVENKWNRNPKLGIDLLAASRAAKPNTLLVCEGNETTGRVGPMDLICGLKLLRYPDVTTRWYVVSDVEKPHFREVKVPAAGAVGENQNYQVAWSGRGVRDHHFRITWQSGKVITDNKGNPVLDEAGLPRCRPAEDGTWSVFPPRDGRSAIRARIQWMPAAITLGDSPPEIESLLLSYTDGRER